MNILLENILIFRKLWLLYDCLYTSRNCRILIKTSIFFRKCLFVHVFIFIKVFYLLENCYFDSKYHFIRWHFGQKCHFPSRICISGGIHSLDKLSKFLRKGHNLGKTTIGFRSNLVVSFEKNDNWFSVNCFVMCVSLVKAKIVQKRQYFHFSSKWSLFSNIFVSRGDIKFS